MNTFVHRNFFAHRRASGTTPSRRGFFPLHGRLGARLRFRRSTAMMAVLVLVQLCAASHTFGAAIGWTAATDESEWDAQSGPVGGPYVNNWTASIPGSGDDALFDDQYLEYPLRTVNLNGNRSVESLNIYGGAISNTLSDYTFDTTVGAHTLTLGNGAGGTGESLTSEFGNHILNCNLFLNNTTAGNQSKCYIGNGSLTINGVVSGDDNLFLYGTRTLILANANSYSGGTIVSDKTTLRVANTTGSATGTGGVIVTNNGTLEGTGRIGGALTIETNGTVSPGDSIGTLTALSNVELNGTYHCELNQANSDRLAVTGALNLTGATLDLAELVRAEASTYTIATCGSRASTFSHVTGLNPHYSIQYTSTAITLVRQSPLRWHVTADATTADTDGTSWTNSANLHYALANADPGDEIWVKAGVYYPDEGTGQTNNDRTATFQLPPGIALLGGFAGTETNADQRDPDAYLTVLSGDIDQNDPNTNGVILTAGDTGASNAYTVVTINIPANTFLSSETRLDGFTITGGRAEDTSLLVYPQSFGGGVYVSVGSPADVPVVENCRLIGNYAVWGGGFFTDSGSTCSLVADTFRGNEATNYGGGAYFWNGQVTATNCLFAGNYAGNQGGGVFNNRCTLKIASSTFSGNAAATSGGAVFNQLNGNPVTFANTIIWNNSVRGTTTPSDASVANSTATTFSYCLIQNFNPPSAAGNLDGTDPANDPLFVTPITIGTAPTSTGNLHLLRGSPAIDAGDQSFNVETNDLDGLARVVGGNIDMGAYEFRTFPLSIASPGNGDTALVTWPGSAALPLRLEATADLVNGPWTMLTNTPVFDTTSRIWSSTIGIVPGQPQQFFRLVPPAQP